MGLFEWLFQKQRKAPESSPKVSPEIMLKTPSETLPVNTPRKLIELTGSGIFSLLVVGESYYQDNLKQICGEYSADGINNILNAILIHADDNQYDNEAIRVEISGKTVGHMSKTDARAYRTFMRSKDWSGLTAICKAKIAGGWDRGQGDLGNYGVSLDLPSDFIESVNSVATAKLNEDVSSEPNTIIFNVQRPHIRDFNEIGANVNLWTPKDNPVNAYIFHRDGPDGRIGTVPLKYSDIIISHILDGREYEAKIIELGANICKIKCRLISKEETELRKTRESEALRIELTKPYNPQKPVTLVFPMKKKRSAKVGDKLYIQFNDFDSCVQDMGNEKNTFSCQWKIKFLNQAGDVVGIFENNKSTIQRILKAHFNSFLFDIKVLEVEEERNRAWGGYLTKLIITPYKK
jgi:hypothetical protein